MDALSEDHMKVVCRILKYLKSSPGKGLFFAKNQNKEVYICRLGWESNGWEVYFRILHIYRRQFSHMEKQETKSCC